jgi:hypothetical protein
MGMHAARVATSARLRRVLAALRPGLWVGSLELALTARTVAPGTCVSELRANGYRIECRQGSGPEGRVWEYRLTGGPESGTAAATASAPQSGLEGASKDG